MQVILATHTEDRIKEIAEQADRILEITNRAITTTATTEAKEPSLAEEIKKIKIQVNKLSKQFKRRGRSQNRFHNTSKDSEESDICYFHRGFGSKTKKYQKPCAYETENKEGSC